MVAHDEAGKAESYSPQHDDVDTSSSRTATAASVDGEKSSSSPAPVLDGSSSSKDEVQGEKGLAPASDAPIASTGEEGRGEVPSTQAGNGNSPSNPNEAAAPESTRTSFQTFVIMASLCASVFLAALDVTIITTALPTITQYFHSDSGYTWIGAAFLLANAATTVLWGKISDIWGRKPILLCAASVFFVGSLLAAVSVSIGMLIVARAIQGIGGGGIIVLVNICISDLFSMRNRGKYFGLVGMVWALASGVGPILGGVFTEEVSWRWCFYINLPITGTVIILLIFFLKLDNPRTPMREGLKAVDWLGSLTMVGGTLMILLGLEFGGVTYPWASATVICLIVFGAVVIGIFVVLEVYVAKYPIMPMRIFKHRSNIASLGVCMSHGIVFISGSYYLPLYFQAVFGATPILSGVYILPFVLALSFVSGGAGAFIKKSGKYLPFIRGGLVIMTIGFALFTIFEVTPNWAKLICIQIVAGIGVGPNFQAPLLALQTKVNKRDISAATATFAFTRQLATSISVVIGSVVFQNRMEKQSGTLTAALGSDLAAEIIAGGAGSSIGIVQSLPADEQDVVRQAYFNSLKTMWIMYAAFAGAGVVISMFIGEHVLSKEHEVTKTGLAEEEARRKELAEEKKRLNAAKNKGSAADVEKAGEQ